MAFDRTETRPSQISNPNPLHRRAWVVVVAPHLAKSSKQAATYHPTTTSTPALAERGEARWLWTTT
jgi:hypothetical protein